MLFFQEDLQKNSSIPGTSSPPQRIVSLVPSQTELLYSLGLNQQVAGITKFCIHPPEWSIEKTIIGGTKNIRPDIIRKLEPDLIIGNKEENVRDQVLALSEYFPVWITDINDLDQALQMILTAGRLTGTAAEAIDIHDSIQQRFRQLDESRSRRSLKAAYLIWKDPYMAVGGGTFINDMMNRCGFFNVFANAERYPEITLRDLAENNCDVVLFSSEPYPFKEKHIMELKEQLVHISGRDIVGQLVDGEMFSWYGSRLLHSASYFENLRNSLYTLAGRNE